MSEHRDNTALLSEERPLTELEQKIIDSFAQLTAEQQEQILDFARSLLNE